MYTGKKPILKIQNSYKKFWCRNIPELGKLKEPFLLKHLIPPPTKMTSAAGKHEPLEIYYADFPPYNKISAGQVNEKCIAGNRTWLYRLPQSQKTMCIFSKAYCDCLKRGKISSSAMDLSLMTRREYRVDRPFPVT
jgi:hypothetical protein